MRPLRLNSLWQRWRRQRTARADANRAASSSARSSCARGGGSRRKRPQSYRVAHRAVKYLQAGGEAILEFGRRRPSRREHHTRAEPIAVVRCNTPRAEEGV